MKKNKNLRLWILLAIVLVALIIIFAPKYLLSPDTPSDKPETAEKRSSAKSGSAGGASRSISVLVAPVVSERVLDGIRSVGSLRPYEQVEISAEISGKVSEILFEEGSSVKKGQAILKINDDDLQAQLKRYEFQEKTLAEKLDRQRILFEREAVSQESFDAVQTEFNVLKADKELLMVKISRCVVRAPFDGVTGFRHVSEGAYISPGMPITSLVDLSRVRIEFAVPEKYNSMKLVGMTVYFTIAGSDVQYKATIYAMEPVISDKTLTLVLRAMCENPGMRLRPGMSAKVVIPTAAIVSRLLIPTEAVIPSMEGKSVWVVQNGKPVSVNIATGMRLEKMVEVTRGLALGDSVIITGLMQLREGSSIKVAN